MGERSERASAVMQAAQVPLHERLRAVPISLRLVIETGTSYSSTPVGHLCHEAAEELQRLAALTSAKAINRT